MRIKNPDDPKLGEFLKGRGRVVVLTGAGISAESGIPTFRGPEGYWTVGSREYHPQEMATFEMYRRDPRAVWEWYLYRRAVCRKGRPNAAHKALVNLEKALGDRFTLITQNVDGLHLAAGNSPERTFQIHGNVHRVRCVNNCGRPPWPHPPETPEIEKGETMPMEVLDILACPACGGPGRPHVLWFDECYDDEHFFFSRSIQKALEAELLVVVGTSGATNLPMRVGQMAARNGAAIMDVNPDENPFSDLALSLKNGAFCQGRATAFLPAVVRRLTAGAHG